MRNKRRLPKGGRGLAGAALAALLVFLIARHEGACRPFSFSREKNPPVVKPDPQAVDLQESFARVAAAVKPAVVSIATVHVADVEAVPYQFFFGDPFEEFFGGGRRPAPRR
ncbi:MAG: hypothetical protein ACT4O3_06295, partial [Elusimicrobiota bacterium]